jgi:hypothetical protein
MKTISRNLAIGLGAAALCASALPAAASSFTQPGATTGSPAGVVPPPGLYFANSANWGSGGSLSSVAPVPGASAAVGVEVPAFIYVPGWNFLGASYAATVAFPFVEVGVHTPAGAHDLYLRAPFNPVINPITLSWNLGNGFFVSLGENVYIPIQTEVASPSNSVNPGAVTSAASFETTGAISYLANDWVLSANGKVGIVTNDGLGNKGPDYLDVDLTAGHTFGKWQLGLIGYYSADIETTVLNAGGRDEEIGFGGYLGYDFGPVDLTIKLTHEFVSKGEFLLYGVHDTRVWTSIVIPIWNPTPPAPPRPVVAKY